MMKTRLKTPLALAAITGLYGCTVLPQTIDRNLDLTPGKGALAIQLMPQRTTQSLADVDHLTVTVQTVDATPIQTLTSADLTNGGASASVTFASLTPCIATISLGAFDTTSEIGSASATVSIQPLMISRVNMDLTVPGATIPVGILAANTTIVDSHYQTTTLTGKGPVAYGTPSYTDGAIADAKFNMPVGIAMDSGGNLFVADQENARIRKITPDGAVSTFAGHGDPDYCSATGVGTGARFGKPTSITIAPDGNFYIIDYWDYKISKMTPTGVVTDFSLNPSHYYNVTGITVSPSGTVYSTTFETTAGNPPWYTTINKYAADGTKSIIAGSGTSGWVDGTGTNAHFCYPQGIAVDASDNVYVLDGQGMAQDLSSIPGYTIRKITPSGVVTTIAGNGTYKSVDGIGSNASFASPTGITIGPDGNLYVTESCRIRKVTPAGVVTTIAGSDGGYADAESGLRAKFANPTGILVKADGTILVVDSGNNAIRKIVP